MKKLLNLFIVYVGILWGSEAMEVPSSKKASFWKKNESKGLIPFHSLSKKEKRARVSEVVWGEDISPFILEKVTWRPLTVYQFYTFLRVNKFFYDYLKDNVKHIVIDGYPVWGIKQIKQFVSSFQSVQYLSIAPQVKKKQINMTEASLSYNFGYFFGFRNLTHLDLSNKKGYISESFFKLGLFNNLVNSICQQAKTNGSILSYLDLSNAQLHLSSVHSIIELFHNKKLKLTYLDLRWNPCDISHFTVLLNMSIKRKTIFYPSIYSEIDNTDKVKSKLMSALKKNGHRLTKLSFKFIWLNYDDLSQLMDVMIGNKTIDYLKINLVMRLRCRFSEDMVSSELAGFSYKWKAAAIKSIADMLEQNQTLLSLDFGAFYIEKTNFEMLERAVMNRGVPITIYMSKFDQRKKYFFDVK